MTHNFPPQGEPPYPPAPAYSAENWQYFYELSDKDPTMLLGYMDCLDRILPTLGKIIETATNYEELKSELLQFTKKQQDFLADVSEKWTNNENDPPCGLPYMG